MATPEAKRDRPVMNLDHMVSERRFRMILSFFF